MNKKEIFVRGYELLRGWQWSMVLLLFGGGLLYLMFARDLWMLLGIPAMQPYFADHYAILAASDCAQQGLDVFAQNPCDPYHRVHVYSRLWLVFSYLGIHAQHNTLFGIAIICTFLLAVVLSVRPRKIDEVILSAVLLSSPAIMLGVERGNSDLIMYTFCVVGVYLLAQASLLSTILANLFLLFAVFLKFYPVASFVVLVEFFSKRETFYKIISCVALIIAAYVCVTYTDILTIVKNLPKPDAFFMTFGARELLKLVNMNNWYLSIVLPAILAAVLAGMSLSATLKKMHENIESRVLLLFLAGAANLSVCFFTNLNYHYRCVYLLCCLPYFFRVREHAPNCAIKSMVYVFYLCMIPTVWAEFFMYWAGDPAVLSILKIPMMEAIRDIQVMKHAGAWGVSLIVLIFFFAIVRDSIAAKLFFLSDQPGSCRPLRASVGEIKSVRVQV